LNLFDPVCRGEGAELKLPKAIRIEGYPPRVAAEALGINVRTLRRLMAAHKIKTVEVVAWKMIPPSELQRLIDSGGVRQRAPNGDGGVRWDSKRRKWRADHQSGGRSRFVGHFDREEDARAACLASKPAPPPP
jgi:hypothetical protein